MESERARGVRAAGKMQGCVSRGMAAMERGRGGQTDGKAGRKGRGGAETPPHPPGGGCKPPPGRPVPWGRWGAAGIRDAWKPVGWGGQRGYPGRRGSIWPESLDPPFPTSQAAPQELLRPRERPWAQQQRWDNARGTATEGTANPSVGPLPAKRSLPNLSPPPELSRSGLAPDATGGSCRGLPASGAVGSVSLRRWHSSLHGPVPLPGLQHCLQAWRLGSGPCSD